jgi:hypothetical protein
MMKLFKANNDAINAKRVAKMDDAEFLELVKVANSLYDSRLWAAHEYREMLLKEVLAMVDGGENLLMPLEILTVAQVVTEALCKAQGRATSAMADEVTIQVMEAEYYRCIVDVLKHKGGEAPDGAGTT